MKLGGKKLALTAFATGLDQNSINFFHMQQVCLLKSHPTQQMGELFTFWTICITTNNIFADKERQVMQEWRVWWTLQILQLNTNGGKRLWNVVIES